MIGKPNWFTRRKYTGWGFTPNTWQGWVYVFVMILPLILLTYFRSMGQIGISLIVVWCIIFALDFIHIMINLPKDERDRIHEAYAERNALWAVILVLVVGVGYQTATSVSTQIVKVDPVIIIAIGAGLLAKMITNIYLDRKN